MKPKTRSVRESTKRSRKARFATENENPKEQYKGQEVLTLQGATKISEAPRWPKMDRIRRESAQRREVLAAYKNPLCVLRA